MPAIIRDLENEVDEFAQTQRWVDGTDGLVQALQAEHFNFHIFDAQTMLKEAATNGQAATVRQLLQAGVPLRPLRAPKPKDSYTHIPFQHVGWLNAASGHAEILNTLLDEKASKHDQKDKDAALAGAALSGNADSVRKLIAYGANPNAKVSKLVIAGSSGRDAEKHPGSVLIYAAKSGNPDVVREILLHNPNLEIEDDDGETALFAAASTFRDSEVDGAHAECVRLLAQAGANVNARDDDGNTALGETIYTDVAEELIKLGANVNARNYLGETPIFTTVDDDTIPLFIQHGADLSIRNKKGQTVLEVAKQEHGQQRVDVLNKAIHESPQN
jgi:ankyrin repeat protein